MKKFLTITAAFALVLGLSQCRKPNAPTINGIGETQHIIIKASNGNDGSKVTPTVSGAALNLSWESTDVITVSGGATGTLTLTNGAGETAATFEGVITKVNDNDLIFTCGSVDYTNQEGTLAWVKSNICLKGNSAYSESGNYDVAMTLPYAVLKLDLSAFGTATPGTTVTISEGGSEVASVTGVTNAANNPYYVAMPEAASREYTFSGGGKTGKATWALAANTFYTKTDGNVGSTGEAIEIIPDVESPKFSVSATRTVEFSKGNLWYGTASSKDAPAFHFEANQWDFANTWNSNHISHFKWGSDTEAIDGTGSSPTGNFFAASGFTVEGHTGWCTLSYDEWGYLLGTRKVTVSGEQKASYGEGRVNGVNGLIILRDDWDGSVCPSFTYGKSVWSNIFTELTTPKWSAMESAGAVFLPAAGYREGMVVDYVGSYGYYWSSTSNGSDDVYSMSFNSSDVGTYGDYRYSGDCVRLVR